MHPTDNEFATLLQSDYLDFRALTDIAAGYPIDADSVCLNLALHARESPGRCWREIEFDAGHSDSRPLEETPLETAWRLRKERAEIRKERIERIRGRPKRLRRKRGLLGALY